MTKALIVEVISSRISSVLELIDELVEDTSADLVEDDVIFLHTHKGYTVCMSEVVYRYGGLVQVGHLVLASCLL